MSILRLVLKLVLMFSCQVRRQLQGPLGGQVAMVAMVAMVARVATVARALARGDRGF